MGFWSLLEVASMPVIQVLIISLVGAYLATDRCKLFPVEARNSMNKVVFVIFAPALMFANLAQTVTLQDMVSWWFMPVNMGLTFLIGGLLGWMVVKILKPPPYLEGLIVATCSSGNMGNLPIILVPAICDEDKSPFGNRSVCRTVGLSYASFSMALGGFYGIEIRLVRFGAYRRSTMAPIIRSSPALAFLVLQISLIFFSSTLPYSSGSEDTYAITGRVKIPPSNVIGHLSKLSNVKVILNGGQSVTFLRPDGYFTFHKVPAGTHLIEVSAMGYFFSPVRVDVSARHHGKVHATLTETRRSLTELVLEPLREEQYYEIREPFSILSIVKSPMGLMVGFMVVVVFLMPKLMENIDPEEMKQAQEEMRRQGVPSLSSLLPSAGASR